LLLQVARVVVVQTKRVAAVREVLGLLLALQ
jgi:hypothetical protein